MIKQQRQRCFVCGRRRIEKHLLPLGRRFACRDRKPCNDRYEKHALMGASCPTDINEPRKIVGWVSYQDPTVDGDAVFFERIVFHSVLSAAQRLRSIESELNYRRCSLKPSYVVQLARFIDQLDRPSFLKSLAIRHGAGH